MTRRWPGRRKGAVAVLTAVVLILLLALLMLAVDVGCLALARTEAQRTADAAALSAVGVLLQQRGALQIHHQEIVETANRYGDKNLVSGNSVSLPDNDDQVAVGRLLSGQVDASVSPMHWNAVRVSARFDGGANQRRTLFFAKVFSLREASVGANATAVFADRFRGFRVPEKIDRSEEIHVPLLPFTLPLSTWQNVLSGNGPDNFAWDSKEQRFVPGQDGMHEVNLYPLDLDGAGNFGTVDIGSNNSNTPRLRRQIENGVTSEDLEFHGGSISLDKSGRTWLSADPGLKATIERELTAIIGKPRIIPLHTSIEGSGQDATYEIRGFAGIRIAFAELNGNAKQVIIQPAAVITRSGIPDERSTGTTFTIFSPIRLQD